MLGIGEENRRQIALVLALVGLMLILSGVATAVMYGGHDNIVGPPAPAMPSRTIAQKISNILFLLVLLVGILMVSTYALVRWTRRYRKWLFHKPPRPTPSSDVWAMHRLPPEEPDVAPDENRSPESGG
jgi:O-antigen/teichoic acid export membrane protein